MDWFYRLNGQETGPINAKDLKALFKSRTITAKTKVRRADMSEWKPLSHFAKRPSPQDPIVESPEARPLKMVNHDLDQASEGVPVPPAAQPTSLCSECGRGFPQEDLIPFGKALICAACKPLFTQKLREGVRVQGTLVYAGFWIRFGAKFIDGLIVGVASMIVGLVIGLGLGGLDESGDSVALNLFIQALNLIIPAIYSTYLLGRYGATLGKMACGIKVVRPDGGAIGYPRALGRHFAEYLSGLILAIGYIMAAFDSEKRTLHDRICSTRVVRK
jgi:uncharacterized RDD family membrane protein YckC